MDDAQVAQKVERHQRIGARHLQVAVDLLDVVQVLLQLAHNVLTAAHRNLQVALNLRATLKEKGKERTTRSGQFS